MSERHGPLPWLLSAAPLALGGIGALSLMLAGDARVLAMDITLPGAVLLTGACASAIPAAILWNRAWHRTAARRQTDALAVAASESTARERENHRRFLARLDHELKNPITAIRATAVAEGEDTPAWRTVDDQAQKLSTLVRDLRKLAELETRPLERERTDLEQLLEEAIAAVRQQHPDAGRRMTLAVVRVPWPVPPVAADPDLLSLAVDNVLANAGKFSLSGPIEIRLREQDGWAIIEVADSGRGIPAQDLPLVFDELARAGNARDVPGSGLGLTLVSTVLQRHGGDASVRSLADAGTVVTLRLPLG